MRRLFDLLPATPYERFVASVTIGVLTVMAVALLLIGLLIPVSR